MDNFTDYNSRPEYLQSFEVVLVRRAEFAADRQQAKGPAKRRERRSSQCAPDILVVAPVSLSDAGIFLRPISSTVVYNAVWVYN